MTSSEVEAVLREAEQACAAVLERPADSVAREKLRSYLATIAAPTVAPGRDARSGSILGLPRQVSIMADIVRGRIERIRSKRRSDHVAIASLEHSVRDLQRILADLIDGLEAG